MAKTLEQALKQLDAKNKNHWTADGLPRMDVLQELTGNAELTRAEVSKAAPTFTQTSPSLEKGDAPSPAGKTAQGADSGGPALPEDQNPTQVGETGADEVIGDKSIGVVGDDPEHPESDTVEIAKEGEPQDADGTLTASADNDRNLGRADEPLRHVNADGEETASRENEANFDNATITPPQNADGSITSNRQTNDEDDARRAGFEPDTADEIVNELERTNPDDAKASDQKTIDSMDEELAKLDAELAEHEEELNEHRRKVEFARAKRDALVERKERKIDKQADQKDRMAFIRKQQAMRADRAGDTRLAAELAKQARGLAASPLDQSLASRPRPVRQLPKGN